MVHTMRGHTKDVNSVSISSNDKYIVSGSHDKTVRLWDAESGHLVNTIEDHQNFVPSVVFMDARVFASGSEDRTIRVYALPRGVSSCANVCVCVCVFMHVCLWRGRSACIYIYMYIYLYNTHTQTYAYTGA